MVYSPSGRAGISGQETERGWEGGRKRVGPGMGRGGGREKERKNTKRRLEFHNPFKDTPPMTQEFPTRPHLLKVHSVSQC